MNGEVSKIFRHIKAHREQPGRNLFCLPSGLSAFTSFALRSAFIYALIIKLIVYFKDYASLDGV